MIYKFIKKLSTNIKPFKTAIFTVIISIVAAFSVSVVSSAGKQIITDEMNAIGLNGLSASAYSADGGNNTNTVFYNTVSSLAETNKSSPIIYENSTAVFENGMAMEVMSWGINNDAADIILLETINGRMINSGDIQSNAFVCLVDKNLAETIYKRDNINGKSINLTIGEKTSEFRIIGTVEKGSNILNTLSGDIIPNFVYIPYTTMNNLTSKIGFDQIVFTSDDTSQTADEFKQKLVNENYKYKNQMIKLTNLSGQKEQIGKIADTAFMALFLVSCVSVVVCSMSVGASVNTAVISRQKDIGIKISMGASRWDIAKEFLFSAVIACIVGVVSASAVMAAIVSALKYFLPFSFEFDITLIALSIFATILLTIVFSFAPSYNASKMSPIKALNRE